MRLDLHAVELPVRLHSEHPLTDDELMQFCAANETLRVERASTGELVLMSPSGMRTGARNAIVTYQLARWAEEDGRGLAFDSNGGVTLPDGSMRSADAAWVRWEVWNALSEKDQDRFTPICPAFVIELRSPSDRLPELRLKMTDWLRNGVELAWLVDPERKVVEVYRPGREPELVEGASAVHGEGPVAGFALELARIWD